MEICVICHIKFYQTNTLAVSLKNNSHKAFYMIIYIKTNWFNQTKYLSCLDPTNSIVHVKNHRNTPYAMLVLLMIREVFLSYVCSSLLLLACTSPMKLRSLSP
jgi:hypothetical protein